MDEQEKVHAWITGMTGDLLRMKRNQLAQPHWVPQMLNPYQPVPPSPPSAPSQPTSSSSASRVTVKPASRVTVKPAPMSRNPSMASAPQNVQGSSSMDPDPWAEARMKQQRQ